ncbi:Ribokinase-like protein [Glonium stellatum]|uniref:Ribokinase-like protein n=1 Tax=Glonium stellatum TaxID=574774 RepID=A0A8E2JRN5_9PEZI|nr:Ribokinase-like protein [Glonium stellatum]
MKRIVAVGACYLDTILTVDYYPREDEKLRASNIVRRRGGNCPNTLEVLQQLVERNNTLSLCLSLCTVLPSRPSSGAQLIKSSFGPMVDLTHCIYRDEFTEPASCYIIKSCSTDSRTIVNYSELPEMTVEEFKVIAGKLDRETSWYHFEGRIIDVTLECMHHLRHNFPIVKISVEVEKPGRAGLQELAAEADVVFYSKSWAEASGYQTSEECLQEQALSTPKASLLCCTWGDGGASALEVGSMTYRHSPAYITNDFQVVDTIGAGDTFIAGMLYGLICREDDWTLSRKLEFANELAGRKVGRAGFSELGSDMQRML